MGTCLTLFLGGVSAAEQVTAHLEEVSGRATVARAGRNLDVAVGMDLHDGDSATVGSASTAVIQYKNGCRYELQANETLIIDDSGPCCLQTAVTEDAKGVVATFGRINGKAMANLGTRYMPAREGMGLTQGDRAMALENSTAVILYANGCRHTLRDDEVLEIDPYGPCCGAIAPIAAAEPPLLVGSAYGYIPEILAGAVALCALTDCPGGDGDRDRDRGGGGRLELPISP